MNGGVGWGLGSSNPITSLHVPEGTTDVLIPFSRKSQEVRSVKL